MVANYRGVSSPARLIVAREALNSLKLLIFDERLTILVPRSEYLLVCVLVLNLSRTLDLNFLDDIAGP